MRILVTGSRDWRDADTILEVLRSMKGDAPSTVVHGDANGADTLAAHAARSLGFYVYGYPADWQKHGKKAGPIRNAEMVSKGADVCVAFPMPRSVGTWDCIRKAVAAGIPVRIYPPRVVKP